MYDETDGAACTKNRMRTVNRNPCFSTVAGYVFSFICIPFILSLALCSAAVTAMPFIEGFEWVSVQALIFPPMSEISSGEQENPKVAVAEMISDSNILLQTYVTAAWIFAGWMCMLFSTGIPRCNCVLSSRGGCQLVLCGFDLAQIFHYYWVVDAMDDSQILAKELHEPVQRSFPLWFFIGNPRSNGGTGRVFRTQETDRPPEGARGHRRQVSGRRPLVVLNAGAWSPHDPRRLVS